MGYIKLGIIGGIAVVVIWLFSYTYKTYNYFVKLRMDAER